MLKLIKEWYSSDGEESVTNDSAGGIRITINLQWLEMMQVRRQKRDKQLSHFAGRQSSRW